MVVKEGNGQAVELAPHDIPGPAIVAKCGPLPWGGGEAYRCLSPENCIPNREAEFVKASVRFLSRRSSKWAATENHEGATRGEEGNQIVETR